MIHFKEVYKDFDYPDWKPQPHHPHTQVISPPLSPPASATTICTDEQVMILLSGGLGRISNKICVGSGRTSHHRQRKMNTASSRAGSSPRGKKWWILCAGWSCQPLLISTRSKKLCTHGRLWVGTVGLSVLCSG